MAETRFERLEAQYEEHKGLIKAVIWRNRRLLAALRLEHEDVEQELSITLLSAIEKFDPERSESLAAYIVCRLQYEVLNMKRRHKPHGMTGVPAGTALRFVSLSEECSDGGSYELPSCDDTSGCEFSEFMDSLTGPETEVIELKVKGFATRRKAQAEALNGMRRKYETLYESERRVAA